ncbi:MAG: methyltransferase [Clostridiales bacterium]|nr:methyltransferase [Clostridiales bacterium]
MQNWKEQMIYTELKKPMPILSFPSVQDLYVTVRELVADENHQAIGMRSIMDNFDMPAAMGYMDLSVEAEAFGAHAVYSADEVPSILGHMLSKEEDVERLSVPELGEGRTGTVIEGIRKAQILIRDRPIFAQCIGPFSLAGRLLGVNDILLYCYEEPEMVQKTLRKAADFILPYAAEFKRIGADGLIMAEPLAGLLSPELIDEFSTNYIREIVESVQDRHYMVIYHNCGNSVPFFLPSVISTGCEGFHFGEAVDMAEVLDKMPDDKLVMGNISPAHVFNGKSAKAVEIETLKLLQKCGHHKNFIISSGCDLSPNVDLDFVQLFFKVTTGFYYRKSLRNAIA